LLVCDWPHSVWTKSLICKDAVLHPDASQYSIKLQILSKFIYGKIDVNRPDDVDSRPDALLLKARIGIQIQPSELQSAIVRSPVHLIWKLWIRLQPFGRLPFMVRTHAQ